MGAKKAKANEQPWIVGDLDTLGGAPRIRGTRISVAHVLDWLAEGGSVEGFVKEYPHIPKAGVLAAIEFAKEIVNETSLITLDAKK